MNMKNEAGKYLIRQFETAWKLTDYHLTGLTTEECLWRPAPQGLHVYQNPDGIWQAEWPDREGYDIGPASIAWLTWHLGFWWSMALNHSFGEGTLTREDVTWPGDADGVRYDLITPIGLRRLAETYAEGACKYEPHNWRKGIPASQMLNHAIRHVVMYLQGDAQEDHLAHAAWNLLTLCDYEETMPEMIDLPSRNMTPKPASRRSHSCANS